MYFYKLTESSSEHRLYTVGYEDDNGEFHPDSDHNDREKAAERVSYLNGKPHYQRGYKEGYAQAVNEANNQ